MSVEICPVCSARLVPDPVEVHGPLRLLACASCDIQVWRPSDAPGSLWYDNSDHYLAMPLVEWLGWYHSWGLTHLPPNTRSLLDIGCADGRFVYAAAKHGIDARGVDHSERLVTSGNQRYGGDRLSRLSVEDLAGGPERYDAVTLFEVVEHVEDPLRLLKEARNVLHDHGVLVVSTPNRLGRPRARAELDRPPHHLTRWTPTALRNVLDRAGFDTIEVALSPGDVGLHEVLLDRARLGLIVGILRRRGSSGGGVSTSGLSGDRNLRWAILAKDRLAGLVATIASPVLGRRYSGGHMIALARPKR